MGSAKSFFELISWATTACGPNSNNAANRKKGRDTNAIVLLKVSKESINEVAEIIVKLEGVSEVYSVAGQYDLAAVIRASGDSQVASLVTEQILKAEGIISSETLIAFRTFSQYDLERMFAIGMD